MPDWLITRDGDHWHLRIPHARGEHRYGPFASPADPVVDAYKLREADDGPVTLVVRTELQERMAGVLGFGVRREG